MSTAIVEILFIVRYVYFYLAANISNSLILLMIFVWRNGVNQDSENWIKSIFDAQGNVFNPCDF